MDRTWKYPIWILQAGELLGFCIWAWLTENTVLSISELIVQNPQALEDAIWFVIMAGGAGWIMALLLLHHLKKIKRGISPIPQEARIYCSLGIFALSLSAGITILLGLGISPYFRLRPAIPESISSIALALSSICMGLLGLGGWLASSRIREGN